MSWARPLKPGDPGRLGDYEVTGRLGQGGQGVVYLGRDGAGEPVAVKLLHAQLIDEPTARSRFVRELELAKQVAAFCTARVLDADVAGDQPYIVSEYVEGPSLRQFVAEEGPRGQSTIERLAIGTATALTAIHRAGVVHRDFKPANVLLGFDGPRVIDFGIARALDTTTTVTGHMMGTPAFMAPEQLTGTGVGPAADMFAWGVTMVYAATGLPAFGQDSAPAVMQRVLHEEPDLRALPESLRDVVAGALAKDHAQRPSAYEVLNRLLGLPGIPDAVIAMAMGAQEKATPAAGAAAAPRPASDTVFLPAAPEHSAPGGAEDFVPGLGERPWPDGVVPQAAGTAPPKRRDNRTLGIVAALAVGILAGVAAIILILRPQLGDGADKGASSSSSPSAPGTAPVDNVPAGFNGTWRGTATNQRGAAFPVEVTFQAGRTTGSVFYPPPTNCNGTLTLVEGTESRLRMTLQVSSPCTDGGTVTVTRRPDGSLGYAWAKQGTTLSYRATLTAG